MIIVDEENNKSLSNIIILLEANEVKQMIGYLEELLSSVTKNEHYHLNNDNYSKEIKVALYDKNGSFDHFSEECKKLILLET